MVPLMIVSFCLTGGSEDINDPDGRGFYQTAKELVSKDSRYIMVNASNTGDLMRKGKVAQVLQIILSHQEFNKSFNNLTQSERDIIRNKRLAMTGGSIDGVTIRAL